MDSATQAAFMVTQKLLQRAYQVAHIPRNPFLALEHLHQRLEQFTFPDCYAVQLAAYVPQLSSFRRWSSFQREIERMIRLSVLNGLPPG